MDKIKRFFECLVPASACNMECSYCYVIQRNERKKNWKYQFKYSAETIGKSLTKERLGGQCYFSICGAGETLMPKEVPDIIYRLLDNGHFVNVTTNGTLTKRFDFILKFPAEYLERLHFAFSFHYLELIPDRLDVFFNNVKKVRDAGCSFIVQLNLVDSYIPHLDEIKKICMARLGALPQIVATRKETDINSEVVFYTDKLESDYFRIGKDFGSPLFDFTIGNLGVRRRGFCYAGDWSGTLNLATGVLSKCYASNLHQNIFNDPSRPINFGAVGEHCQSLFCFNASHFIALGVMPSVNVPSYSHLRNREEANWYSPRMRSFLSQKLYNNNDLYSGVRVAKTHYDFCIDRVSYLKLLASRLKRRIFN